MEALTPELSKKLETALNVILGNEAEYTNTEKPLTQAEYDLRIQYVRLSWRLLAQIGPFNFAGQAGDLLKAMSLSVIRGDNEETFVKLITDTIANAGMAPIKEKP